MINPAEIATDLHQTGWIKTFSGRMIQPLDLKPDDVCIEDIAHALSRVCRFAGHCHGFLNVAAHSVRVLGKLQSLTPNCDKKTLMTALLHDASEAYLGDVPRPLKRHPGFAFYREVEARVEEVIAAKFDLIYPMPAIVKAADDECLREEMQGGRYSLTIEDCDVSENLFLAGFYLLTEMGGAT